MSGSSPTLHCPPAPREQNRPVLADCAQALPTACRRGSVDEPVAADRPAVMPVEAEDPVARE